MIGLSEAALFYIPSHPSQQLPFNGNKSQPEPDTFTGVGYSVERGETIARESEYLLIDYFFTFYQRPL